MQAVPSMKACSRCGESKPFTPDCYPVDRSMPSGLRPECRECKKAYARDLRLKNGDTMRAKERERVLKNGDRRRAVRRDWYHRNKDSYAAYQAAHYQKRGKERKRKYNKERYKSDIRYRLRTNLSAQFRLFLKNKPLGGFQAVIGYTVNDLILHLTRCFTGKMSWDNYGGLWEIDHIVPSSSFNLPEETAACWALTNLRPLLVSENRTKSAKRLFLL